MGLISAVTGLFTKSDENVGKGLDLIGRAGGALDRLHYSEEEKAEMGLKTAELKLKLGHLNHEFVKSTLEESSVRSYTRRVLAWSVTGLGIFLTLYSLAAKTAFAIWEIKGLNEIANHALALLEVWWPIIGGVGLFYFGAHVLRSVGGKK